MPTTQSPDPKPADSSGEVVESTKPLNRHEKARVLENQPPRAAVLYETVRHQGEEELSRTTAALAWSALAAGLTMGFSMLARALLHVYLQGVPAAYLLECFGYTFGFLAVIMARQQLFTENTITAVIPVVSRPTVAKIGNLARVWIVVLIGNLCGVALFAFGLVHLDQFDAQIQQAFVDMGEDVMRSAPWPMFTKGILAGWIIAMMVWMISAVASSKLPLVIICTYLVGIAGLTHIVVGSCEILYLVFTGHTTLAEYVWHFAVPTLFGNIVGGSLIFALLSHAQVKSER